MHSLYAHNVQENNTFNVKLLYSYCLDSFSYYRYIQLAM